MNQTPKDNLKSQGYLMKWVNMWQGWQRRYFIIQDSVLMYKEAPESKTKGTINLQVSDIRMSAHDPLKISIRGSGNYFKLRAISVAEKIQWIDWLRQAQLPSKGSESSKSPTDPKTGATIVEKRQKSPEICSDLDSKNQELLQVLERRFHTEDSSAIVNKLAKIYSIQSCMDDTLADFVAEVQALAGNEKIKSLADRLELLSNDLKTVTVDALRLSGKLCKGKTKLAEDAKGEDRLESSSSNGSVSNDDSYDTANEEEISKNASWSEETEYRLALPAKRTNLFKVSLWHVLKDMIGKDLTHLSVPILFMEPITMLQKVAECLEHEECLRKAAASPDPLVRMAYVITFMIAQYSSIVNRIKKPFNPILGETYEYVTHNYKFFSEQVSHHPPISTCHCHSDLYEFWMHTHLKFSFWGKTFEGTPLGSLNVYLKKFNERYIVSRPKTYCGNIIIGKMFLDCYGDCTASNTKTGDKAKIHFKKRGWFGKNYGAIDATIFDAKENPVYELIGSWTNSITLKKLSTGEETLLWKMSERPREWEHYYYFPEFVYQLNNIPERLKLMLPPTDSRFRPDQRALENGDMKASQNEKIRLEELQRIARKEREKANLEYKPVYFVESVDEITKERMYIFNWKYWQDREQHNWKNLPTIF